MKESQKKDEVAGYIKALKKIISEKNYDIDKTKLEPLDFIYLTKKLDQYSSKAAIKRFIQENKKFIYYLASHSLAAAEIILGRSGLGQYLTASETSNILTHYITAFMQKLIKDAMKSNNQSMTALEGINHFIRGTHFKFQSLLKDNYAFDILHRSSHMRSLIQHIDPVQQFSFLAAGKYDDELKPGHHPRPFTIASIIKNNYKQDPAIKKFLNANPRFLFNLAKEDFETAKLLLSSKPLAKNFTAKEIAQIVYKFRDQLYEQARKQNENVAQHYYLETDKFINQTGHSLKTLIKIPEVANLFKSHKNLSAAVHAMQQDAATKEKNVYKSQTNS